MAKDPAVLFYTSDFLTGTALMNMTQRGRYITLLCLQHQQGHLSEEDMLDICGGRDLKVFAKFERDENGLYYNERMDIEGEKRRKFVKSKVENGKKGGRPKKQIEIEAEPIENLSQTDSFAIAKATEKLLENENENIDDNTSIFPFSYSYSTNNPLRDNNECNELLLSKQKEKETDKIINNIYLHWNSKGIIVHKKMTEEISSAIERALKVYSEDEIRLYIDRYTKVIGDSGYFWSYKWTLKEFLSRKDGISSFTDEGSKWVNYCDYLSKSGKGQASDDDDAEEWRKKGYKMGTII